MPPSTERNRRILRAYGLALLGVAGVTAIRIPLEPILRGHALYALYYLPILVTAWFGGVSTTVVAIVLLSPRRLWRS